MGTAKHYDANGSVSTETGEVLNSNPRCPNCRSDALYRYGKTGTGKEHFLCLICNRQFVKHNARPKIKNRPKCPNCGKQMHIYMRAGEHLRFRCADYPTCRTYVRTINEEGRKKR